jgi:hypothetical protein
MLTWRDLLLGVVLPAVVTGSVMLAGWRLARHRYSARESRSWAGPLAVALGFIAGYLALFGWTGLPPHDAVDWLLPLAALLALLGTIDSYYRLTPPGRALLIAVAVPISFLLLAWPLLSSPGQSELPLYLMLATAISVISLVAVDAVATRTSAGRLSALLLATTVPAAVVLGCSGSARLGLIATLLAATQAGAVGANIVLGRAGLGRGIVVVCGTLLAGLLWCGHLYAKLQTGDSLLLAIAPNMAWFGRWAPRRFGWLVHVAAQMGLVLAVAGLAAIRAWLTFRSAAW